MIQFKATQCEACAKAGKHEGAPEVMTMEDLRSLGFGKDEECQCRIKVVGSCDICGCGVDEMGEPAVRGHVTIAMKMASKDQPSEEDEVVRRVSICGPCLLALDQFVRMNQQHINRTRTALEPKVIPASRMPH